MAKISIRDKKSKSNPIKMIDTKRRVFRLKCWIVLLAGTNLIQFIINNCL